MTMTPDIQITALKMIDAVPSRIGNRLLALFDATISGVCLQGCALIEGADGIARVKGPAGKTHKGDVVRATIIDPALERAITRKAAGLYAACTGRELADE
ncbi:hypothetical protein [Paracoccus sp. MC1862]|uniref:hypothetical protein n=1 Tax=Paracoccus sp. MC1862 TaxID=2760307 RepID=UPI0016024699|nr:hypothetical protein [Paracoccus sp. MC1862]MBB1498476.1 hypothetical protein [Paracoccus sp. MC1862]QQO43828.1 hypothetical protein JGR78_10340 [Paracoccus sp. MC1862]